MQRFIRWMSALACLLAAGAADGAPPRAGSMGVEVDRTRAGVLTPGHASARLEGPEGTAALTFGPATVEVPELALEPPLDLETTARGATGIAEGPMRVRPLARWEGEDWAWGWAVDVSAPARLEAWRVYLDARGRPLGRVPLHQGAGAGRAFARSPLEGEPMRMVLADRPDAARLAVPGLEVVGCTDAGERMCSPGPVAAPNAAGDWLFEAGPFDPDDAFAEVHTFLQLVDGRRRLEALGLDAWARPLLAVVNLRLDLDGDGRLDPFDNAVYLPFWDQETDALLFGQASTGDVSYDVDVLRHELAHAATWAWLDLAPGLDALGYDHLPAALSEGWADYFAAAASGDPGVGRYLGSILGMPGALRRVDADLGCPEDLLGEAHADGQIWSGALWTLRGRLGPDLDVAVAAAIRALPDQPSIGQAAEATAEALRVGLGQEAAEEALALFEARGLGRCDRIVPLPVPGAAEGTIPMSGVGRLSPGSLQHVVDVPGDAERVTLRLSSADAPPHALRLYARAGEPVGYRVLTLSMSSSSVEVDSDAGGTREVVVEGADLAPGDALYVSAAALADRTVAYRLEVEVERASAQDDAPDGGPPPDPAPPPAGAAEPPLPEAAAGGCAGGPGLPMAVLLLEALRRRRRRRPRRNHGAG